MIFLILAAFQIHAAEIPTRLPSQFPGVPLGIVEALKNKNCIIPQSPLPQPNNLISGEFAQKGQKDWAAFCSAKGKSKIVIIWGGSKQCPSEIRATEDSIYMQELGKNKMEFSRSLNAIQIDPKIQEAKYKQHGGPKVPKVFDHEALSDAIVEKASEIEYCVDGNWLGYLGSD